MKKNEILDIKRDPMGAAILDCQRTGKASSLRVMSSMFEDDEMPVAHLFRSFDQMPRLEQKALETARGRVLDIGAGAGCHALALQERGVEVKAIDISPLSCQAMRERGIKEVECVNLFDPQLQGRYDTLLLLMNGTGVAGKLERLPALLNRLKELLADGGQILVDSSDLRYVYENEDALWILTLTRLIMARSTIRCNIRTLWASRSTGFIQTLCCLPLRVSNVG